MVQRSYFSSYFDYIPQGLRHSLPWTLSRFLSKELSSSDTVLDIGCGPKSPLRRYHVCYSLGIEIFDAYLQEAQKLHTHSDYIKADCTRIEFKPRSFDIVLALDVIEHLSKEQGLELIGKMKSWARKKVIIQVPNQQTPQGALDNNEFQRHRSGYRVEELVKLGFGVKGIGLKVLSNSPRNALMGFLTSMVLYPIRCVSYYYPQCAYDLLAIYRSNR